MTPYQFFKKVDLCEHAQKNTLLPWFQKCLKCCWPWKGYVDPKGYGKINCSFNGQREANPHKVAYRLVIDDAADPTIHVVCITKLCCNPAHIISEAEEIALEIERSRFFHVNPYTAISIIRLTGQAIITKARAIQEPYNYNIVLSNALSTLKPDQQLYLAARGLVNPFDYYKMSYGEVCQKLQENLKDYEPLSETD